jgi:uncharacterized membrane protein
MKAVNTPLDGEVDFARPRIRKIEIADLRDVLAKGLDDFMAMPTHSVFVIVIYPIMGLVLLRLSFGYDMLPVIFPLIAGFALLGPFTAIGLYEMSRRREQGLPTSWEAFDVFSPLRCWPIVVLGIVLMVIFVAWLIAALTIYESTFNNWYPSTVGAFLSRVFTTAEGWTLIAVGVGVGFLFAVVTFAVSVVSFPMLVDRNVGVAVAVATSLRAVAANPVPMAAWGIIVVALLVIGSLPILVGLAVVLPVLGHATWHLYRKLVETEPGPGWRSGLARQAMPSGVDGLERSPVE